MLDTGAKLPALRLVDDSGNVLSTGELLGRPLVVYFYPKDDTSGCTGDFAKKGARIVGVSRDSAASHLPADVDAHFCAAFGTLVFVWPKVTVDGHAEDVLSKL